MLAAESVALCHGPISPISTRPLQTHVMSIPPHTPLQVLPECCRKGHASFPRQCMLGELRVTGKVEMASF